MTAAPAPKDERRRSPFSAFIGTEMEELGDGYARLSLRLGPQHANPNGVVHGGVITTMMDSALGAALGQLRGEEARRRPHATVAMSACFLASVRPGEELAVEGRVLRLGRTVAFGEAEARRRSDGALVARGSFTFAIPNRRD